MNPALPNWYYVYLLKSKKIKWVYPALACKSWVYPALACKSWVYIGCTNNLEKRMVEHKEGKVFSTRKMLPVDLIYFEAYKLREHAYRREKNLKQYGSSLARLKLRIGATKKGRAG